MCELVIFQTPARGYEQVGWRLDDKAIDSYIGTQTVHDVTTEVKISFKLEHTDVGAGRSIFASHARPPEYLELVDLDHVDRESIDGIYRGEHVGAGLTGQPHYQMQVHGDAGGMYGCRCPSGVCPRVSAVDALQCGIMA